MSLRFSQGTKEVTMSNNKQQPKPENPNNQFSNTEPLTHAQRVAIANKMSNNKQSSVEWLAEQLTAKMQMWNSTKNYQEFHIVLEAGEFAKLIEQSKAMHKEEIKKSYTTGFGANLHQAEHYYNQTFGQ